MVIGFWDKENLLQKEEAIVTDIFCLQFQTVNTHFKPTIVSLPVEQIHAK